MQELVAGRVLFVFLVLQGHEDEETTAKDGDARQEEATEVLGPRIAISVIGTMRYLQFTRYNE